MLIKHLGDDIDRYTVREAEFGCNTVIGFNFGDGHFHDEQLIAAIQKRCRFEPGEFIVAWVESQPIHKDHQQYKIIDAALGVIERGTYRVADAVRPAAVAARRSDPARRSPGPPTHGRGRRRRRRRRGTFRAPARRWR